MKIVFETWDQTSSFSSSGHHARTYEFILFGKINFFLTLIKGNNEFLDDIKTFNVFDIRYLMDMSISESQNENTV